MSDPQMARDYARYYRHKRRCEELRSAIDAFLVDPDLALGTFEQKLGVVRDELQRQADHVVAVWD